MKKPKTLIRVCVHLLLCVTLGVNSTEFVNPVTDDITRITHLKQNIPKDYKIPLRYIPKSESGMCWVQLNIAYLEQSLKELAHKFGNISSNRYDIAIFVQMLQDMRYYMGPLDVIMFDFECHYRDERWQTQQYFEYVEEFLKKTAETRENSEDCEPPPCPTEPPTTTTTTTTTTITTTTTTTITTTLKTTKRTKYSTTAKSFTGSDCDTSASDCKSSPDKLRLLPEVVERSLLSLLLVIPIVAIVFLFVWKVKARKNHKSSEQSSGEGNLFHGSEGSSPPLADDTERNSLSINIEYV